MLKETILTIEDKDSPDYGKTFKIKQAPVLAFEKILNRLIGSINIEVKNNIKESIDTKKITIDHNITEELLTKDILNYLYFVNKELNQDIQLINNRVDDIIEDINTLILLQKEFFSINMVFTKLVDSLLAKTTIKK